MVDHLLTILKVSSGTKNISDVLLFQNSLLIDSESLNNNDIKTLILLYSQ